MPTTKQLSTFLMERMEGLSGYERGLYLQIALHQIKYGDVFMDGNFISNLTKMSGDDVKKCWPNVKKLFKKIDDRIYDPLLADKLKPKKRKSAPKKPCKPPTKDQVIEYFTENGESREQAIKAYEYYNDNEWHDAHGKPVIMWKGKMRMNWFGKEVVTNNTQSVW